MHGAATDELVGGRRCDGGGRGSSAGLRCLPREEWFEDLLGAPVLLHEACVIKRGASAAWGAAWGGGGLEQPRRWLAARWAGLSLGVPRGPEPPGAP